MEDDKAFEKWEEVKDMAFRVVKATGNRSGLAEDGWDGVQNSSRAQRIQPFRPYLGAFL